MIKLKHLERLKALREDNDLTQTQVASLLNVNQITYSQYERGKRALPIEHLKTLCIYYNVQSDYILGIPQGLDYPKR